MALDIQQRLSLPDLPSYHSNPSAEDRISLPSIGTAISRPPSTSSQASSQLTQPRLSPNPNAHLPGLSQLSALASIATTTSSDSPHSSGSVGFVQDYLTRSRPHTGQESLQQAGGRYVKPRKIKPGDLDAAVWAWSQAGGAIPSRRGPLRSRRRE
jgi:hypothetical protein